MEDLKAVLLGVLAEVIAHFLIQALEERTARRKGTPKHMRLS